jgi:exonuclease III
MELNRSLVSYLLLSFLLFSNCRYYSPSFPNEKIQGNYPKISIDFATQESFDVLTWNLENFPKSKFTLDYVAKTINSLDMDVIALQEIKFNQPFEELLSMLPNYDGFRVKFSKHRKRLAFIYKKDIEVKNIYQIYKLYHFPFEIPFSRAPFVLELEWKSIPITLINNHFPNSSEKYKQRQHASKLLKSYIDNNFKDKNLIVLGDLNDKLTDQSNLNTFQNFLDDNKNYIFTDMNIANSDSTKWSFPRLHIDSGKPSHIDHILISSELFDEFNNPDSKVEVITLENQLKNNWQEYYANISDHRPVALRLYFDK